MAKHAIFLNGPIGAGKTTLGRALAERLAGGFIDGDDVSDPSRPWYCSILRTSQSIIRTGAAMLDDADVVVIAYPLGCVNWIYFRRKFSDAGVFASVEVAMVTATAMRHVRPTALILQSAGNLIIAASSS
jgi:hypothetical protein